MAVSLSALRTVRALPQSMIPGTNFSYRLRQDQGHCYRNNVWRTVNISKLHTAFFLCILVLLYLFQDQASSALSSQTHSALVHPAQLEIKFHANKRGASLILSCRM
jgi:hypothetical protein